MSGVKNVHKNHQKGETWCVDRWCCTTNLDAPYPSSLPSHSSLSFPPLVSPSHLASSFPVTNIASIRTIERVQKDVPTTVASNSLLEQVVIAYLRVRIYHKISADSHWKFDSCVVHTASDPVVDVIPISTLIKRVPSDFRDVFLPRW